MQHQFTDLVDIGQLQELTDELYRATAIPSAIITLDGEILTGAGWQRICTDFHRKHPVMEQDCIASDTRIRTEILAGSPFSVYQCPRGLTDAAAPIVIDGEHVANVFVGQLFTTPADDRREREFREQARGFGLDEEEYVSAMREVPVYSAEKFGNVLNFLAKLTKTIGEIGLARKREMAAAAEQERLRAELTHAQKMEPVGRLAGGVAHDFNNMLGVIIGQTQLALQQPGLHDNVRVALEQIEAASLRSAELTRQLLAFARKQAIEPRVVDLNQAVGGVLKMLRRLIGEDIDLAWTPGADLWLTKIDPAQLDQILANLCVNARDAITGHGRITMAAGNMTCNETYCASREGLTPGDYILLVISDTGCGMDAAVLDHLFEPFFTTKAIGEGTGLGLATVYGIVQQNDGFVEVFSERGIGTSFRIYLPRFGGELGAAGAAVPIEVPNGCGERVLVVEDEPALLRLTVVMLEALGYTVVCSGTPQDVIRFVEASTDPIDLLITDVIMPEINGRELAARIESLRPGLPCLFMSGYTADVIAARGVIEGTVHLLHKPFSRQEIAVKVRSVLDAHRRPSPAKTGA